MRASNPLRAVATATVLVVVAAIAALLPGGIGEVDAAPRTSSTFDQSGYRSVSPTPYRSLAYANNGRHYFVSGRVHCQIGPQAAAAACRIKPRTAPPGVIGVALSGESQGPYWVRSGSSFRLGPMTAFRAPALKPGTRITVADVTCAVPKRGVVVCRNWNRGFRVSRSGHTFLYPRGDRAHDGNPTIRR